MDTLQLVYSVAELLLAAHISLFNLLVLWVYLRTQRLRTITNTYIFSLALTDFLAGTLGIPLRVYTVLTGEPNTFASCMAVNSIVRVLCTISTFHLLVIAIDKYLSICCCSTKCQLMINMSRYERTVILLSGAWLLGALMAILPLFCVQNMPEVHERFTGRCHYSYVVGHKYLVYVIFVGTIIVPSALIAFCYASIYLKIKIDERRIQCLLRGKERERRIRGRKKLIRILSMLVLTYSCCWYPLYLLNTINLFLTQESGSQAGARLDFGSNFATGMELRNGFGAGMGSKLWVDDIAERGTGLSRTNSGIRLDSASESSLGSAESAARMGSLGEDSMGSFDPMGPLEMLYVTAISLITRVDGPLTLGAVVLSHCSCAINPLIYAYGMPGFKQALRQFFRSTKSPASEGISIFKNNTYYYKHSTTHVYSAITTITATTTNASNNSNSNAFNANYGCNNTVNKSNGYVLNKKYSVGFVDSRGTPTTPSAGRGGMRTALSTKSSSRSCTSSEVRYKNLRKTSAPVFLAESPTVDDLSTANSTTTAKYLQVIKN